MLTGRELFALPGAPAGRRRAQNSPSVRYRDYSRCLPDYLRRLAGEAYRGRNRAKAGLKTPEAIRERQC